MNAIKPRYDYLLIALLGLALFVPGLGRAHLFDWDEINFAECAREMLASSNWLRVQIDYRPFWEKPPLFIWLQALSMAAFGVNEFAARLPNALVGVATLLALYHAGRRLLDRRMGWAWVGLYVASWLPHFYFKSGIIDPLFNLLIFLALYQLYVSSFVRRRAMSAGLAGIFLGLAVLTKGPVALLIAGLVIVAFVVWNRGPGGIAWKHVALALVVCLLTASSWFLVELALHGPALVMDFIVYQVRLFRTEDAGHGGPFFYHWIVLLAGCFPASVLLFQRTPQGADEPAALRLFTRWMWVLFWVVLILFSIVKTKIVHYSSLCYFPLTYLAALQAWRMMQRGVRLQKVAFVLLLFVGLSMAFAIAALPVVGVHKDALLPYLNDPFAAANLAAGVHWNYAMALPGVALMIAIVAAAIALRKGRPARGWLLLGVAQVVAIQVAVLLFVPRIEGYSQRAAIDYFKSLRGQMAEVYPLGYKSYAHLFYAQKPPGMSAASDGGPDWYLYQPTQRPVYFIAKVPDTARWAAMPQLRKIGEANGFVFFKKLELAPAKATLPLPTTQR